MRSDETTPMRRRLATIERRANGLSGDDAVWLCKMLRRADELIDLYGAAHSQAALAMLAAGLPMTAEFREVDALHALAADRDAARAEVERLQVALADAHALIAAIVHGAGGEIIVPRLALVAAPRSIEVEHDPLGNMQVREGEEPKR